MQTISLGRLAVLVVAMAVDFGIANARDLTFDERVQAQRAIENVFWSHRIWPKENEAHKPALAVVMSDAAIREKVLDYLEKSSALDVVWHRPITGEQLQAELDRMARDTHDGATLRELFDALGDDPSLIAETLARQSLATRLVHEFYAADDRFHGQLRRKAQATLDACRTFDCTKPRKKDYQEMTWRRRADAELVSERANEPHTNLLTPAEWNEHLARLKRSFGTEGDSLPRRTWSRLEETPDAFVATTVIAQSEDELTTAIQIWRRVPFDAWWQARRGRFDSSPIRTVGTFSLPAVAVTGCTPNSWVPTSPGGTPPAGRTSNSAVWTGTEMIVWGGFLYPIMLNTGGRYSPTTDSWAATSMGANVPATRSSHTAVWTGTEMVVWGGHSEVGVMQTGGRYNPTTDTWTATSTKDAPEARTGHTGIWVGSELIVWGGESFIIGSLRLLNSGGRYDPNRDKWTSMSTGDNVPEPRMGHTAIWSGTEMVVWGGGDISSVFGDGGRYDPRSDTWTPTSTKPGVPSPRTVHEAVWTGQEMIVWGGIDLVTYGLNTGGRYDPRADSWQATSTGENAPPGRINFDSIWTGAEMVIWGGPLGNYGSRYDPQLDSWTPIPHVSGAPTVRQDPSLVWTGTEMLLWGGMWNNGSDNFPTEAGRYCIGGCVTPGIFYQDRDGDGYGDPTVSVPECQQSPGYADNGLDCDDADSNTFPFAPEVKDGKPNRCGSNVIDEISGSTAWDGSTFRWTAQMGATGYQVVRSPVANFASGCVVFGPSAVPYVDDPSEPEAGAAFFYLVRSVTPDPPGSWGQNSGGIERIVPCS